MGTNSKESPIINYEYKPYSSADVQRGSTCTCATLVATGMLKYSYLNPRLHTDIRKHQPLLDSKELQ